MMREKCMDTQKPQAAPYKAVVVLMMLDGADSFNLLVPTSECATNDQYQEYVIARGPLHPLPVSHLTTFSVIIFHMAM